MNTNLFRDRTNKIHAAIEAALQGAARVVYYSAYKLDAKSLPVNNLNKVAARGTFVVVASHDDFWGEGENFVSEPVTNPTWLQLAVLANKSIECTGDRHHSFFEGICKQADGTLRLVFGS